MYWGGGGGGGYDPFFGVSQKKLLRGEAQKGLMPDFFMRTRKKIRRGGGGLYPNFWCVLKNVSVGGGGLMPDFLCVLGREAYARFLIEKKLGGGRGYTQIFGVYSKYITAWGGGGGELCQIFLCILENY